MTQGTITNKHQGVTLSGEKKADFSPNSFEFIIDGSSVVNVFDYSDWDFTPDGPRLPVAVGSVVLVDGLMPFTRVGSDAWIVPQSGLPREGKHYLAFPVSGQGLSGKITNVQLRDYLLRNAATIVSRDNGTVTLIEHTL
jgi:hypothetical protein